MDTYFELYETAYSAMNDAYWEGQGRRLMVSCQKLKEIYALKGTEREYMLNLIEKNDILRQVNNLIERLKEKGILSVEKILGEGLEHNINFMDAILSIEDERSILDERVVHNLKFLEMHTNWLIENTHNVDLFLQFIDSISF